MRFPSVPALIKAVLLLAPLAFVVISGAKPASSENDNSVLVRAEEIDISSLLREERSPHKKQGRRSSRFNQRQRVRGMTVAKSYMAQEVKPFESECSKNVTIKCEEQGYFGHPTICSKFYRCVDFTRDGKTFTIFHFECEVGNHFDESMSVCNNPWAISPAPPCMACM